MISKDNPIDSVQLIETICVRVTVGKGTEDSPYRLVEFYYSHQGVLLAVADPFDATTCGKKLENPY
jgi:hypothetical protein